MFFMKKFSFDNIGRSNANLCSIISCRAICASFAAAAAVFFAAGCSRHQELPLERSELVLRFFQSIRKGDSEGAVRQGNKISSLDKYNTSIKKLISIQECNRYIKSARNALARGDVQQALKSIEEGRKHYPANRRLTALRSQLRQLRNAEKLLGDMRRAKSSTAMISAMSACRIGLSANRTDALLNYFKNYENFITKVKADEEKESAAQQHLNKAPSAVEPLFAGNKKP
jgi:hypothetical protein